MENLSSFLSSFDASQSLITERRILISRKILKIRRQRRIMIRSLEALDFTPLRAIKKFRHVCRRKKCVSKRKHRPFVKRQRIGPLKIKKYDIYKQTGIIFNI